MLTGTSVGDYVGSGSIAEVGPDNAVVASPEWNNRSGAATWINGGTGLNGTVSASNSLVGTSPDDRVGTSGVRVLTNDNYVVSSPLWDLTPFAVDVGAVTWVPEPSA